MDISEGFQIEKPNIFVPWDISSEELATAFSGHGLRRVVDDYFVIECISLGGLSHKLGFHFHPGPGGEIRYLEFFDNGCADNASAFWEFQKHLEATFGKPSLTAPGDDGFPSYTWRLNGCLVRHYVAEHFGPAESVHIQRDDSYL